MYMVKDVYLLYYIAYTCLAGLAGLNSLPEKSVLTKNVLVKPKSKDGCQKETFIKWYAKNKKHLQEEFPELSPAELTTIGLTRYKEQSTMQSNSDTAESLKTVEENKKRKLSSLEDEQSNEAKRPPSSLLSEFAFREK